jgi:hypothetical protein
MRWLLVLALALVTEATSAEPQGNASLTIGGAAAGPGGRFWDHGEFHLGLRGDCIFLRETSWDFGLGPYGEVGTWAFNQLQTGAGLSVLLPIDEVFPLVLSAGGHARFADDDLGIAPGVGGAIFWGSRSFNHHESYVLAAGLLVDVRHSFGAPGETMLTFSAQIDTTIIALPFIALGQWMAGPTAEARPIE